MKLILTIVGVLLMVIGVIWILQGFNILPVGFMAGQMQYALLGAILIIAGLGLVVFSRRRKAEAAPSDETKRP